MGVERSIVRYRRLRAGYQQLPVFLRREGWRVNHKRIYRLYTEEGLALRRRRPRRHHSTVARVRLPAPTQPNEQWATDFMHGTLADGRAIRVLTVLNVYTRECVALLAARSFSGGDVVRVLTAAGAERGLPQRITADDGTELTSRMLDHWAHWQHVALEFSRPGKPVDNTFIEAFNGTLRRECLSLHWFPNLAALQQVLNAWRNDYNPPSSEQQFSGRPSSRISGWRSIYPGPQPARIPADLVCDVQANC